MRRALSPRSADEGDSPFALPAGQLKAKSPFAQSPAESDRNGKLKNGRNGKRGIRGAWSAEMLGLLVLFAGALVLGWFASTWIYTLEFGGPMAGLPGDYQSAGAATTTSSSADTMPGLSANKSEREQMLDSLDARAVAVPARQLFTPPFTREKYLQYFRPLHYGERSLTQHGGNRRVEERMAAELLQAYQKEDGSLSNSDADSTDELWDELRYRGSNKTDMANDALAARLSSALDKLVLQEQMGTSVLDITKGSNPNAPYHGHKFAFKMEPEASRDITTRTGVCPALEKDLGKPMDPKRNMLFLIGAQKGGTTYLFNALTKHKAFVGADHAYGQGKGPWAKEVHFFNRWPLPSPPKREFLRCYPTSTWNIDQLEKPNGFTLIDGTPDYLFNAFAPPRVRAIWPKAKFLVLLRDPVARAFSAWSMSQRMSCKQQVKADPVKPCVFPSFAQMVVDEIHMLKQLGCTFGLAGVVHPRTWADCYGCRTSFADPTFCKPGGDDAPPPAPCTAQPFLTLSVSNYAAQLAWWFSHFPRDRFKIITSEHLHAKDPVPVLNDILEFTGIDAPPFTPEIMRDVWGYNGGYNVTDLTALDHKAVQYLQLYFRQADADLNALLASHNFTGVTSEMPML